MVKSAIHFIAIMFVAVSLAGCSGGKTKPETVNEKPSSGDVVDIKVGNTEIKVDKNKGTNIKAGGVEIQANEGGVKLPADFPNDLPIYSGATVKHHVINKAGGETSGFVQLETAAPVEKVAEYYRAELKSQGWTESQHTVTENQGKTATILGAKKGARTLAVTVTSDLEGNTIVNLTLADGK